MNCDSTIICILAVVLPLGLIIGVINCCVRRRRAYAILRKWAEMENVTVLKSQRRHMHCGNFSVRATRAQQVFRVAVKSECGSLRRAFVLCGSSRKGLRSNAVEVEWDLER